MTEEAKKILKGLSSRDENEDITPLLTEPEILKIRPYVEAVGKSFSDVEDITFDFDHDSITLFFSDGTQITI